MRALALAAALALIAVPALALPPQGTYPKTAGSGVTPQIAYPSQTLATADNGTPAGTATVSGLSGGSWAMNPATAFSVNSSTGAVSAVATLPAATYTPTLSYAAPGISGQTITVSMTTSIVVQGVSYSPSLDFSNANNSQYVGVIR